MRRFALAALIVAVASGWSPVAAATPPTPRPIHPVEAPPQVTARSWLLFDDTFGIMLAEQDAHSPRPMASTTKIMTALIAYESGTLDEAVTVSEAAAAAGEAEVGLVAGEELPLWMLVRSLLVRSANDAATAVAEAVGGTVSGFVAEMNRRALELGMLDTHFENPHGLDSPGHFSTATDLLALAQAAMEVPEFAESVAVSRFRLPDAPDGTVRIADATNALLETYPGAIGVKTGFTFQAGLVLVAAAERDGRRLYAIVMGSEGEGSHFGDAAALLDYGFDEFGLVVAMMTGRLPATAEDSETLTAEARSLALLHLAAQGLGGTASVESEIGPSRDPFAVPESAPPPALPGLGEAVGWIGRYWNWITGDA